MQYSIYDQSEASRRATEHDDEYGFNQLTHETFTNAGGFRKRLEEFVATNKDAQQAVLESGGELPTVAKPFYLSDGTEGTIVSDSRGTWRATVVINGEPRSWASESRDSAMLMAESAMAAARGPRELTPQEELLVKRLALNGESANAAQLYCELRLSNMKHRSEQEILTDPSLVGVLNEGAIFVWACTRPDYLPSPEFSRLLDRASATRVLNINIVDILWDRFTESQAAAARSTRPAAPENEPATPRVAPSQADVTEALAHMSDEKIDQLKNETLRHRGHLIRRFDEKILGR